MLATLSDQTITRVGERNRRKYGEGADESILRIITNDLGLAVAEVQRGRILPTHQTLSYVQLFPIMFFPLFFIVRQMVSPSLILTL